MNKSGGVEGKRTSQFKRRLPLGFMPCVQYMLHLLTST